MQITIDEHAAKKITDSKDRLASGSWGGGETVCMMSALVSGATDIDDCVTAGWPEWLARLNVGLFDATVGADNEDAARFEFALEVARAVQKPRNYEHAMLRFLIATLNRSKIHDAANVTQPVIDLLERALAGEDVAGELKTARAAAAAAAAAAARAAARAAAAAAAAARAAAYAAAAADAAAYADAAADASADAAARADADARAAARADARANLIAALKAS